MTSNAKKKTVDGIQFTVAPFPVTEALKVKMLLAKTIGPALGEMVGSIGGVKNAASIGDMNIDGHAFSGALEKLIGPLDGEQFLSLIQMLFQNVSAVYTANDGNKVNISFGAGNFDTAMEAVFSGRIFSIYPVILLVLEANFPDFFGRVARGIGSLIPAINTSGPETPSAGEGSNVSGT